MTWISRSISLFGAIMLAHACYSAQEHSALQSFRAATAPLTSSSAFSGSSSTSLAAVALPVDITIETIAATLIMCAGLVLGMSPLRPILWREWAGQVERAGEEGFRDNSGAVSRDFVGNPYYALETRPNFVDIRRQRREFAEWAKGK